MKGLQIYYPFKPFVITQNWGNPNSAYAAHFGDPTFKLHNGIDAKAGYYDWQGKLKTDYPVYCPVEGFKVVRVDYQPNGGGNEIWLRSKEKVKMFELECYCYMILCHAKKILVPEGYEPALGELLMIADNTGFSTGLHTHLGIYRMGENWERLDTNEATGSFNPALFFTEEYAVDKASAGVLITSGLRYLSYILKG